MNGIFKAVLIGVVQGITEWLPVSSTGHMILLSELVNFDVSPAFWELFLVVIQLASVLAVPVMYFDRLSPFGRQKSVPEKRGILGLWCRILVAVLPSAAAGLLLDDFLSEKFFGSETVIAALAFYGVLFILLGRRGSGDGQGEISVSDALKLGLFQTLALIPGTSRSGSVLLGGLILGLDRAAAAEFSFFMALPTMFGAGAVKLAGFISAGAVISRAEGQMLIFGSLTAFLLSLAAMRYLMERVKKHGLAMFGIYRLALAAAAALILLR